jgi:hypothetical protein
VPEKKLKQDRDEITVAKSIFDEIVEFTEHEETPLEKRASIGGAARSSKLSPERRSEIAKKAASARWESKGKKKAKN